MVVSLVVVVVVVVVLEYLLCGCCCGYLIEFWSLFVLSGGCFVLRSCLLLVLSAEPGTAGCISIFNINIFSFACQPN